MVPSCVRSCPDYSLIIDQKVATYSCHRATWGNQLALVFIISRIASQMFFFLIFVIKQGFFFFKPQWWVSPQCWMPGVVNSDGCWLVVSVSIFYHIAQNVIPTISRPNVVVVARFRVWINICDNIFIAFVKGIVLYATSWAPDWRRTRLATSLLFTS